MKRTSHQSDGPFLVSLLLVAVLLVSCRTYQFRKGNYNDLPSQRGQSPYYYYPKGTNYTRYKPQAPVPIPPDLTICKQGDIVTLVPDKNWSSLTNCPPDKHEYILMDNILYHSVDCKFCLELSKLIGK